MKRKNVLLVVGLIGLMIVVSLNLVANYYLNQPAAMVFSEAWNATWLPSYIVWLVMCVIGTAIKLSKR